MIRCYDGDKCVRCRLSKSRSTSRPAVLSESQPAGPPATRQRCAIGRDVAHASRGPSAASRTYKSIGSTVDRLSVLSEWVSEWMMMACVTDCRPMWSYSLLRLLDDSWRREMRQRPDRQQQSVVHTQLPVLSGLLFHPSKTPQYCDRRVCLSVCACAYLKNRQTSLDFVCMLPVAVTRSFCCDIMYFRCCWWRHVFPQWALWRWRHNYSKVTHQGEHRLATAVSFVTYKCAWTNVWGGCECVGDAAC